MRFQNCIDCRRFSKRKDKCRSGKNCNGISNFKSIVKL